MRCAVWCGGVGAVRCGSSRAVVGSTRPHRHPTKQQPPPRSIRTVPTPRPHPHPRPHPPPTPRRHATPSHRERTCRMRVISCTLCCSRGCDTLSLERSGRNCRNQGSAMMSSRQGRAGGSSVRMRRSIATQSGEVSGGSLARAAATSAGVRSWILRSLWARGGRGAEGQRGGGGRVNRGRGMPRCAGLDCHVTQRMARRRLPARRTRRLHQRRRCQRQHRT